MTPTFGVVIPTLGRSGELEEVLASLAALPTPPKAVAINDQSEGTLVAEICERWQGRFGTLVRTSAGGGASAARNAAIDAILSEVEWIATLDDDSRITSIPWQELATHPEANAFVGVYSSTRDRIAATSAYSFHLDRRSVWTHAIESAMLLKSSALGEQLRFDESLGVGCPTPWQSGEGTDLLLRLLQQGTVVYLPGFVVEEITPDEAVFPIDKHRRYARGTGRVYRRWMRVTDQARALVGPLVRAARAGLRRDLHGMKLHSNVALGRLEGLVGKTLG